MITLDDTLNRNYYFYSGSGEVRLDFVKQIFNQFLGYDFNSFMSNKIKEHMGKGKPRSIATERAAHQAVETCLRSCASILKYRKEIKEHLKNNPGLRGGITDKRIDEMRYTDLKTLRTNLGLSRRGKKVTKVEPAPLETITKAKEEIKKQPTAETVANVYASNIASDQADIEEEYSHDSGSYTLAEISAMEGYEVTREEAIAMGYQLDDLGERYPDSSVPVERTLPEPRTPSKEELIAGINEDLRDLPREYVEQTYWYIQDIKENKLGRKK